MPREPLSDPYMRQWRRLILYGRSRERQLLGSFYAESSIRYYYPYTLFNEFRLSRNTGEPWDDDGLPLVIAETDGTYSVWRSDGSPDTRGAPADVAARVAVLLQHVARPRGADSRRKDLEQAKQRAWPALATSTNQRVRRVAARLLHEAEARRYFPHIISDNVQLSRSEAPPWDDEGLPQLVERADREYVVLAGDGEQRASGDLEAAIAVLVQLLAAIRTATRDFQDVLREALPRGDDAEMVEIVRRFKPLGLGQREAHDALVDLLRQAPESPFDPAIAVIDVIDGLCPPEFRIWETELDP